MLLGLVLALGRLCGHFLMDFWGSRGGLGPPRGSQIDLKSTKDDVLGCILGLLGVILAGSG